MHAAQYCPGGHTQAQALLSSGQNELRVSALETDVLPENQDIYDVVLRQKRYQTGMLTGVLTGVLTGTFLLI